MSEIRNRSGSHGAADKNINYRVVVMGAAGVGKSSIISQFLYDRFNCEYKETVEELHRGQYNIGRLNLTLEILDTAGHNEFPAMRKLAISTSNAFVLVFSMKDRQSFDEVQRLREEIVSLRGKVPIVIVGNKADISTDMSQIDRDTAESIACVDWESGFVEASAKDNTNIIGIFQELLRLTNFSHSPGILRRRMSVPSSSTSTNILNKKQSCVIS